MMEPVDQAMRRYFAALDPRYEPFIGLYNTRPCSRYNRLEFSLELWNAVTGTRTSLGVYLWTDALEVVAVALDALAYEKAALLACQQAQAQRKGVASGKPKARSAAA